MKRVMLMILGMMLVTLLVGVSFADDNRFVFSDKTVKDKRTGLIWTRDAKLKKCDWKDAFEFVKELNRKKYAGFKDWRLPGKEEISSLWDYAKSLGYADPSSEKYHPYILFNKMGFYDVQADFYWSSQPTGDAPNAWGEHFGNESFNVRNIYQLGYAWPVRGGQ